MLSAAARRSSGILAAPAGQENRKSGWATAGVNRLIIAALRSWFMQAGDDDYRTGVFPQPARWAGARNRVCALATLWRRPLKDFGAPWVHNRASFVGPIRTAYG